MKIGDRIRDTIDQAVRHRDKLLVVLSENSIGSPWVEEEVETALEEERHSPDRRTVLFPVRLDDAVLHTELPWARKLRRERHIGDFTRWKDHDAYQKGFERLLRDLKPELERRPGQGA
jgi:TIR domain